MVIADDHPLLRRALRRLFHNRSDYQVVAEAGDGEEAVRITLEKRPDLVLVDRVMPKGGGLEAARRIGSAAPEVRVVLISGHVGSEGVVEAEHVGAAAFISKIATWQQTLAIVDAVRDGRTYEAIDGAGTTIERSASRPAVASSGVERLTPREREVLRLVAQGHTSVGVASILRLSPRTVETHRQHIMGKLGIHSVAGLTRFAIECGDS
jgi:DNA-binding NarL/FixJ family response regulator